MLNWLLRQWQDIKGNVKYAIILGLLSGIMSVFIWLTHGLSAWRQGAIGGVFALVIIWAAIATWGQRRGAGLAQSQGPILVSERSVVQIHYQDDPFFTLGYEVKDGPYTKYRIGISSRAFIDNVTVDISDVRPQPMAPIFKPMFPHRRRVLRLNPDTEEKLDLLTEWLSQDNRRMVSGINSTDDPVPIENGECWHVFVSVSSAISSPQTAVFYLSANTRSLEFGRIV